MLFEAKLSKLDSFKKLIESVKELVHDAVFDCLLNGIEMQAMDSSHISLVLFLIKKESFVRYKHSRDVSLGINLISISKILKCGQPNDSVTLKVDNDCEKLIIIFESPDEDRVSEFDLKLINISTDNLGIPQTTYDCEVRISSGEFNRICQQLSLIGNSVEISVTKGSVQFMCSGDMGNGKIVLNQSVNKTKIHESNDINVTSPVSMIFALRFLHLFSKASSISARVKICMSKDIPALLEYEMIDLPGHLRFYLAPKIDND